MTKKEIQNRIEKFEKGIKSSSSSSAEIAKFKSAKAELERALHDLEKAEKEVKKAEIAHKKAVSTKKPIAKHIVIAKTKAEKGKESASARLNILLSKLKPEVAEFNKGRTEKELLDDENWIAKPAGKRISAEGNTYYENRANRSDASQQKPYLAKGGKIKEVDFENSNLILYGGGVDTNGNHIVKIGFPNSRAFSIQTNGVLKNTNYILKSKDVHQLEKEEIDTIEKEVVEYVKDFGSKEQKAKLKTYSTYSDGGMMAKGGEVEKDYLLLVFKPKRYYEIAKEHFDTKEGKSNFYPYKHNDEFKTFYFKVNSQNEADNLERFLEQELEEIGLSEYYFESETEFAKGGRVGKDTYLNPPENPNYMITKDAKKNERAKPSGWRYTNVGAKRLKIDNPKAYPSKEHIEKYKGKYFTDKQGVEHRYIYIERRADKADMRRVAPYLELGGTIPNNYKGKSAQTIWHEWTLKQRSHFLLDHEDILGTANNMDFGIPYSLLPQKVKDVLREHISNGEYELGGEMESGGVTEIIEIEEDEIGENINVFGYQTEHFIHCPKAVSEFKKAIEEIVSSYAIDSIDYSKESESLSKAAQNLDKILSIEERVAEKHDMDMNLTEQVNIALGLFSIYNYKSGLRVDNKFIAQHLYNIFDVEGEATLEYEIGGSIEVQNKEMVSIKAKEIKHHANELIEALKGNEEVPAWVVAKIERSATDISDSAHYLEGMEGESFGKGGAFGGNSGYEGYSMSKRAVQAYEDGKLTYSKLPTWAKRMVDSGMATTNEWHHTSSYGNQTSFYNVQQFFDHLTDEERKQYNVEDIESFKDVPKQLVKDIDERAKVQLKKKNSIKEVRKVLVDAARKELNEFKAKFKTYIRVKSSPKYGVNEITEMQGKFGWFDSSKGSYNLPEYYTGVDYETEDNKKKAIELESNLDIAENKNIYRIELLKRGFTNSEITNLKDIGIITSEIMPDIFYYNAEKNKDIIKKQIKQLSELPNINSSYVAKFYYTNDEYLTENEINARQDYHQFISEQGENFGDVWERRNAHINNDLKYENINNERFEKAKKEFLNSDAVKEQEQKFNHDKQEAINITENLQQLFNIDTDKKEMAFGGSVDCGCEHSMDVFKRGGVITFSKYTDVNKPMIGDKYKSGTTNGIVYEVSPNGNEFKLKDEYGNKSNLWHHINSTAKAKISRSKEAFAKGGEVKKWKVTLKNNEGKELVKIIPAGSGEEAVDTIFTKGYAQEGWFLEEFEKVKPMAAKGKMAKGGEISEYEVIINKGSKNERVLADFATKKIAENFVYDYGLKHPKAKLSICKVDEKSHKMFGGGMMAKGGNIPRIEKKVEEVNRLIELGNANDIEVVDESTTWQTPMKFKPLVYKNGVLYIEWEELDLYRYNRKEGTKWEKKKDKVLKSQMQDSTDLNQIAKWYRKALKKNGITFESGGVTFKEKVSAIANRLKGIKVKPKYRKKYGITYDAKEAKEAATKIVGKMVAKEKMSK